MQNDATAAATTFQCTTCLAPIHHRPTFHVGLAFCCAGCVADGPCICTYDLEEDDPLDTAVLGRGSGDLVTVGARDERRRLEVVAIE